LCRSVIAGRSTNVAISTPASLASIRASLHPRRIGGGLVQRGRAVAHGGHAYAVGFVEIADEIQALREADMEIEQNIVMRVPPA
jgi:hypothetical protein